MDYQAERQKLLKIAADCQRSSNFAQDRETRELFAHLANDLGGLAAELHKLIDRKKETS